MASIQRIGILTSGGDCAGLNPVIRAVVSRASALGWTVVGIRNGTAGLLARPVEAIELDRRATGSEMLRLGGTILGTTNKGDPFAFPTPTAPIPHRQVDGYRQLRLDALIGIGGDGSLKILRELASKGAIKLVGIPKTIDNDLGLTEVSIGFETAVQAATSALDHLTPTAASHSRVMVLEVMGRDSGHIALQAGIAGGADVILIPEIPYKLARIAAKIEDLKKEGRNFALIVVAEAVQTEDGQPLLTQHTGGQATYGGIGHYISERIAELTGAETRVTVLGHVQRGGSPEPGDRVIASAFGVHAVDTSSPWAASTAWWPGRTAGSSTCRSPRPLPTIRPSMPAAPWSSPPAASASPSVIEVNTMTPPADGTFWTFTLGLYGKPGVAPALIGLQDRLGLDVNMLLYCCWAGADGRLLSRDDLKAVEAVAEPWQSEVVRPLRALRRRLKGGLAPCRRAGPGLPQARQRLEIEGEHRAERHGPAAARASPRPAPVCCGVAANLKAYLKLRHAGRRTERADHHDPARLLRGCDGRRDQRFLRLGRVPDSPSSSGGSPQRRTRSVSRPKRSSTRPTL
jgi:6-phosphofructokinase 1